ncbi:hypothetical protein [Streptomyces sp. ODS28]|uniref:hypothetical protein n=1 Tax=Streptomyces sp. ODS28 TaxID=3136688 RepID=UPI0031E6AF1E
MTLVAVCGVKGSPGATTAALGLASGWPAGHQPVVVECDAAGGDLLARFRLETSPGLVGFAAATRRPNTPGLVWQHTQRLPGGLSVVAGPPGAEQARVALEQLVSGQNSVLRQAADRAGTVVVADCGRLEASSPAASVVREADVLLVLARARDDALSHVATTVQAVARWSAWPCFVLVGEGYPTAEVEQALGIEVTARLPEDARGAATLNGAVGRRTAPARSPLGRALAALAAHLQHGAAARAHAAVGRNELAAPAVHFRVPAEPRPYGVAQSRNGAPQ